MPETASAPETRARQRWMSVLAKADPDRLDALFGALPGDTLPQWSHLRPPEIGLVMVRGRTGGVGDRFNLGEMTVTRAAVRLDSGETGLAWRSGRDRRAAELAAVLDAVLGSPRWCSPESRALVDTLEAEAGERRERTARRSGATRVHFFTMTRSREQK